jgi:hypothetical protein
LHLWLTEAEVQHQVLLDQQKFSQSTTQKNWSSFKILSRQVLRELGIIPEEFLFVQLSIGNGADFGDESIEKLEEAL